MGAKKAEPTAVVMDTTRKRVRKPLVYAAGVAVLLAVAFSVHFIFAMKDDGRPPQATDKQKNVQAVSQSQELKNKGDYKGEVAKISEYLATNPPEEYAQVETIRLGHAYMNQGEYQKALEVFQGALEKYKNAELAATRGIAFAYMKKGEASGNKEDYQKAIEWFEKAIEVAKKVGSEEVTYSDESNIRYIRKQME